MNYSLLLMTLLGFIPDIAQLVEKLHKGSTVETKTQAASDSLSIATKVAAAVLPPEQATLAVQAGAAAQNVLTATVAAVHAANNPPAVQE